MYRIEADEKQMRLIARFADVYSRLCTGQFEMGCNDVISIQQAFMKDRVSEKRIRFFRHYLELAASEYTDRNIGEVYGIHSPEIGDDARFAAHFQESIHHAIYEGKEKTDRSAYPADIIKGLVIKIEKI